MIVGVDLQIHPNLPALLEIEEPNRQQLRRAARGQAKCRKCFTECPPDDVCFADGQDAHRSCAEIWNAEIFSGWDTFKEQDECAAEPSTTPDALALTAP